VTAPDVNVERKPGFSQVVIWPGCILEKKDVPHFELSFLLSDLGTRAQYLETIVTRPDLDSRGQPIPGTGGRSDVFFAVHDEDIGRFAIRRIPYGMRWIEDAISRANGGNTLYPARVEQYATWTASSGTESEPEADEEEVEDEHSQF
jgi:hypothetical protein